MATKTKPKVDSKELYIKIDSWEKLYRLGQIMFIMDIQEAIDGAKKAGLMGASIALECDLDRLYKMKPDEAFHMGKMWWWMIAGKRIDLKHFERILALTPYYLWDWGRQREEWIHGRNESRMYQRFTTMEWPISKASSI